MTLVDYSLISLGFELLILLLYILHFFRLYRDQSLDSLCIIEGYLVGYWGIKSSEFVR